MTSLALPAIAALLASASPASATAPAPAAANAADLPDLSFESVGPLLSESEILELEAERNDRLTVPVTLDDAGPFRFMIDTGSQATAITHHVNQTLGLTPFATATLVAMASMREVDLVRLDTVSFGSKTLYDIESPILERRYVGADGILGLDVLQDLRVLFDFREETLAVEDVSEKRRRARGFEIIVRARSRLGQLLIANATVEGVRTMVIIDTGAQGSLGNLALRDRLRAKRAQDVISTDVNGVSMIGRMSQVRSLNIEGVALQNVPLTFADAPAFEALGLHDEPVIALGMQHLRLFDRVAIDFSNRRVMFDVPASVGREIRRNRNRNTHFPL